MFKLLINAKVEQSSKYQESNSIKKSYFFDLIRKYESDERNKKIN